MTPSLSVHGPQSQLRSSACITRHSSASPHTRLPSRGQSAPWSRFPASGLPLRSGQGCATSQAQRSRYSGEEVSKEDTGHLVDPSIEDALVEDGDLPGSPYPPLQSVGVGSVALSRTHHLRGVGTPWKRHIVRGRLVTCYQQGACPCPQPVGGNTGVVTVFLSSSGRKAAPTHLHSINRQT